MQDSPGVNAPSLPVPSPDLVVALDDEALSKVVGALAFGPGGNWFDQVAGPGSTW
jgi:hypothetical protein